MLRRFFWFVLGHVVFIGLTAAIVTAEPTPAGAQAASPYDTTFVVVTDTPLYASPEAGAATIGTLARGTRGVVLRWCRPEFPFSNWAYGGEGMRRKLLADRVCEIGIGNVVGFVPGGVLQPE